MLAVMAGLALAVPAPAQDALVLHRYDSLGIWIGVPEAWTQSRVTTTTKAEFFGKFGWNYTGGDAGEVWSAFGSFSHVEVDEALEPADEAYRMHVLTLFVSRARTYYSQWLCRRGRRSLWEPMVAAPAGGTLVDDRRLRPPTMPGEQIPMFGRAYTLQHATAPVPTVGRIYAFTRDERCYVLRLESTTADAVAADRLHDRVFGWLRVLE